MNFAGDRQLECYETVEQRAWSWFVHFGYSEVEGTISTAMIILFFFQRTLEFRVDPHLVVQIMCANMHSAKEKETGNL